MFFALPDGSGLLYSLVGTSDPPKPISTIVRDIPCKMNYTEVLPVTNWLRKPQRFVYLVVDFFISHRLHNEIDTKQYSQGKSAQHQATP